VLETNGDINLRCPKFQKSVKELKEVQMLDRNILNSPDDGLMERAPWSITIISKTFLEAQGSAQKSRKRSKT